MTFLVDGKSPSQRKQQPRHPHLPDRRGKIPRPSSVGVRFVNTRVARALPGSPYGGDRDPNSIPNPPNPNPPNPGDGGWEARVGRRHDEALDIAPEKEEREDQWNKGSREKKGDGREEKKTGGRKEKHRKNSKTKEEEDGDKERRKERIEERKRRNHLPDWRT